MQLLAGTLILGLLFLLIVTGISAIPTIIFVLDPDSMRYSFDDPAEEQDRLSRSADLREWTARLRDMGFSLLGVKAERLPLWGRAYREAALVSRAADTYASIVLDPANSPASLYFYTPLENGGMVFTRNHPHGRETETETVTVKNIPSQDFREVFDSHEKRLRVFLDKGWRPLIGSGQQARIEATRVFYKSSYARQPVLYLSSSGIPVFIVSVVSILALVVWNLLVLR